MSGSMVAAAVVISVAAGVCHYISNASPEASAVSIHSTAREGLPRIVKHGKPRIRVQRVSRALAPGSDRAIAVAKRHVESDLLTDIDAAVTVNICRDGYAVIFHFFQRTPSGEMFFTSGAHSIVTVSREFEVRRGSGL